MSSSLAPVTSDGCSCVQEGDGEVFQLKKTNLSKKLKLGKAAPGYAVITTTHRAAFVLELPCTLVRYAILMKSLVQVIIAC